MMWHGLCRYAFSFGRFNFFGGQFMLIGFLLMALIVYFIVRNSKTSLYFNNSEAILKERLAKGEINEDQYENLLKKVKR